MYVTNNAPNDKLNTSLSLFLRYIKSCFFIYNCNTGNAILEYKVLQKKNNKTKESEYHWSIILMCVFIQ